MWIEGLCARITARIRTSAVWCSSCWLNWCHTCAPPRLQASESVSRRSSHVTSLWACWLCFGGAVAAAVSTAGVRAWPWRSVSPSSHRFAIRTTCTYTCAAHPHMYIYMYAFGNCRWVVTRYCVHVHVLCLSAA